MAARGSKKNAVLIDVSSHMNDTLRSGRTKMEEMKDAVVTLISQKIMNTRGSNMNIVAFGSRESQNSMFSTCDDYRHINVLTDGFEVLTPDLIRKVQSLQPENGQSDVLSGLLIACDELYRDTKAACRSVYVFADLSKPIPRAQDLSHVIAEMKSKETDLYVVAMDLDGPDAPLGESHALLEAACAELGGSSQLMSISNYLEMMSSFRTKEVAQTTKSRVELQLTPSLKIPVFVASKTSVLTAPSLKKRSKFAAPTSLGETERRSLTYLADDASRKAVSPDEVLKAYKYGKEIVPVGPALEDLIKLNPVPEKCLQVIAAVRQDNINRAHILGTADCVYTPNTGSGPEFDVCKDALYTLVRALDDVKGALVCRYVFRDKADPKLVLLTPSIEHLDKTKRSRAQIEVRPAAQTLEERQSYLHDDMIYTLTMNQLPFSEDVRHLAFPLLPSVTDEQAGVMDALVDSMDLSVEGVDGVLEERVSPHLAFNPFIQRLYATIQQRALNPSFTGLAPLNETLEGYLKPERSLMAVVEEQVLPKVREVFALKVNAEADKQGDKKRKFWREVAAAKEASLMAGGKKGPDFELAARMDALSGEDIGRAAARAAADAVIKEESTDGDVDMLHEVKHEAPVAVSVGTANPVRDFKRYIEQNQVDLVVPAMQALMDVVRRFLFGEASTAVAAIDGVVLMKAAESLIELRKAAVSEMEPKLFNDFLRELKDRCVDQLVGKTLDNKEKRLQQFWDEKVLPRNVTLVHMGEAQNSDVSAADSEAFLKAKPAVAPAAVVRAPVATTMPEEDDLLDLID